MDQNLCISDWGLKGPSRRVRAWLTYATEYASVSLRILDSDSDRSDNRNSGIVVTEITEVTVVTLVTVVRVVTIGTVATVVTRV